MKVYNGEGMIMGRLASKVAKDALLGEEVYIVNCEKVMISGKRENSIQKQQIKRERVGYPLKSQHHSRMPERVVRRAVRGMLPWKNDRGKVAFKRIMCYRGIPTELATEKLLVLEDAKASKLPNLSYITISDMCKALGGKQ